MVLSSKPAQQPYNDLDGLPPPLALCKYTVCMPHLLVRPVTLPNSSFIQGSIGPQDVMPSPESRHLFLAP